MRTFLLSLLLLASSFCKPAYAQNVRVPGCDQPTTIAQAECRTKQIDRANAKLQMYLDAARNRVVLLEIDPATLEAEQAAWENYRTKLCGNVYERWAKGTIRHEMSATCMLLTTQVRTVDIWRAYLTHLDSTPPVLPEPSQ